MGSPVAIITTAKKMIENGKPNRKRILVAPQVPSGPVNDRCIALRATWPSAAMMVKGIQSEATVNMGIPAGKQRTVPGRTGAVNRNGVMTGLRHVPNLSSSRRTPGPIPRDLSMRAQSQSLFAKLPPRRMGPGSRPGRHLLCRYRGSTNLHPLGHHHVVHIHVGRDAPSVGERVIDHAGLLGDGELIVGEMPAEFVGRDELVPLMGAAR